MPVTLFWVPDLVDGLTTQELASQNVSVHIGAQDGEYLQAAHSQSPIDWFVYTAALSDTHPELVAARQLEFTPLSATAYSQNSSKIVGKNSSL